MRRAGQQSVAAIAIVMLICSLAGCYTLLKHPDVLQAPEDGDFARCIDCHPSYFHPSLYHSMYVGPWWDYYELPWWYQRSFTVSDSFGGRPDYRGIISREMPPTAGTGIGVNPLGVGSPLIPVRELQRGRESASDEEVIEKGGADESKRATRSIEKRETAKRKTEDEATKTKNRQPAEDTDASTRSGEPKDASGKKKDTP
jgi:hypothetical protein